ncbi:MAG TPA: hypothetical protein VLJ39_10870 [Tepidisphaeraceae bacterium]|jgi:hypothetical protein|nr:hypothetical protein [Tepidisphaeraceae bacterium]
MEGIDGCHLFNPSFRLGGQAVDRRLVLVGALAAEELDAERAGRAGDFDHDVGANKRDTILIGSLARRSLDELPIG